MPDVSLDWLNKNAAMLVKKHWGLKHIPKIEIDLERDSFDWKRNVGYYCNDIETIVFSSQVNKRKSEREIKKILLHELVHWYLHTTGQRFRDSDERFARELIRVGLGKQHNSDEQSVLAAKAAWKRKKDERFEIIEENEEGIITARLRHHRKNGEDFKRDLANTLIRAHNEREEDITIYPGDIADMMCEWYGYKLEPLARVAIRISSRGSYLSGEIGDRDDISEVLHHELDMTYSEIDLKLKDFEEEELEAANEDS
ncbi:SprT-like domain-containing protein [Paenibacillus sp. NPDC057886]|uniref:SprT-like domain-containing protein n=1 Tax=Paenibacillus sp. NPDC057886 TaxID=3346270 RepID=UPI00369EE7B3